jgi:hypothetical protein
VANVRAIIASATSRGGTGCAATIAAAVRGDGGGGAPGRADRGSRSASVAQDFQRALGFRDAEVGIGDGGPIYCCCAERERGGESREALGEAVWLRMVIGGGGSICGAAGVRMAAEEAVCGLIIIFIGD